MALFAHASMARCRPATSEAPAAPPRFLSSVFVITLLFTGNAYASSPGTPIVVRMYNAAGVSDDLIQHLETDTSRVFATADFDIRWEDRRPQANDLRLLDDPVKSVLGQVVDCPATPDYSITVQITDRFSRQFRPRAVAFALPFAHTGVRVTIFYDRVERIARNVGVPLSRVLAAMLAHELGHVLIGTDGHGESIMRPEWDAGDFHALQGPLPAIGERDVRLMHRHIAEWQRSTASCREDSQISAAAGGE